MNGSRKQPGILQHHRIGLAQAFSGHTADLMSVHRDCAVPHIIKTHQKIDQRCFSGSGGAYDRNHLPRLHKKAQIMNDHMRRIVAKLHMGKLHLPLCLFQPDTVRRICRLRRFIQKLKYALCRCQRRLQIADDIGCFVDRSGKLTGIEHKRRNISHAHLPL